MMHAPRRHCSARGGPDGMTPMQGGATDTTAAGGTEPTGDLAKLLAETLKAVNKDSLAPFAPGLTVGGASVEATRRTYQALDDLAAALAGKVAALLKGKGIATVLLQAGEDLSEMTAFRALLAWMAEIEDGLGQAPSAAPAGSKAAFAFAPATVALVGSASQAALAVLGALVRSTVSQAHAPVAVGEAELMAALEPALRQQGLEPRRLSALLPRTVAALDESGRLLARLRRMARAADASRVRLGAIDAALAAAPQPPGPPDAAALRAEKLRIEAALKVFDAFWASVPAMLPRLLLADAAEANRDATAILTLRILAAGGTTTVTSRFWGSSVEHAGAVLVRYALYGPDDELIRTERLAEEA
jgi:hypothetical protein